jgi:hypothetical protein
MIKINMLVKLLNLFLLIYLILIVIFYPVSRMYVNEYETVPIKFELTFFMLALGIISNTSVILKITNLSYKYKKTSYVTIIFTVFMNSFFLLSTNGNPLRSITNENWNTVRFLFLYITITFGLVLYIIIWKHRDEN